MKGLLLLFVVAAMTVVSCGAHFPVVPGGRVTCAEEDEKTPAHFAVYYINHHHQHGYKFQLGQIRSSQVEKHDTKNCCIRNLRLELEESKCHVVNPKNHERCERRYRHERVTADCDVVINVKHNIATVTEYKCNTKPIAPWMVVRLCPDCPTMLPLNHPEGYRSIEAGVNLFNTKRVTIPGERKYRLLEVGRITTGYIPFVGMAIYSEFAIVETHCPVAAKILVGACQPLCPDRAHYGFCTSSWMRTSPWDRGLSSEMTEINDGMLLTVKCELYDPKDSTLLRPGHGEPRCPVPPPSQPCSGAVTKEPTIHPICSWQSPEPAFC